MCAVLRKELISWTDELMTKLWQMVEDMDEALAGKLAQKLDVVQQEKEGQMPRLQALAELVAAAYEKYKRCVAENNMFVAFSSDSCYGSFNRASQRERFHDDEEEDEGEATDSDGGESVPEASTEQFLRDAREKVEALTKGGSNVSGLSEELLYCQSCNDQINVYIDIMCTNDHTVCPTCFMEYLLDNNLIEDYLGYIYYHSDEDGSKYGDEDEDEELKREVSFEDLLNEMKEMLNKDDQHLDNIMKHLEERVPFYSCNPYHYSVPKKYCPVCNMDFDVYDWVVEYFQETYGLPFDIYREKILTYFDSYKEFEKNFEKKGKKLCPYDEKSHDFLFKCVDCGRELFGEYGDGRVACEIGHDICSDCYEERNEKCAVCEMTTIPDYLVYKYFLLESGKTHEDVIEDMKIRGIIL